jgi:1,4-alpha-glucan branching enzyme
MRAKTLLTIFLCCVAIAVTRRTATAEDHEFRYKAPDAKSVELMSEFNGWKAVPMTKGSDGVWTAKVSLSTGTHAYKFLVNGTDWVFDPNNSNKQTVDGVENSAVEIK